MAEEKPKSEANDQSAKGGGSGGMLPALLIIVLMPLVSFAMFKFMFIPMIKAEMPEAGEHAEIKPEDVHVKKDADAEPLHYQFPEAVNANIKGTNMTRYVRVLIAVESVHGDLADQMDNNMFKLRDHANTFHEKPEMKTIISNELKMGFNKLLGDSVIEHVYLPEYAIQ